MSDTQKIMKMIKEHEVKYVDFRFAEPAGVFARSAMEMM
jgi:glutamine synthetase